MLFNNFFELNISFGTGSCGSPHRTLGFHTMHFGKYCCRLIEQGVRGLAARHWSVI
jgi:hypothetical protein